MVRKFLIIGLILVVAFVAWEVVTFPDVRPLATSDPKTRAFMERRKAEFRAQGKSDALEYRWTSYANISPYLRRAVLVSEDNTFYEHSGVDVQAMRDAIERDWKRKKITHGGSTITQQLAKNLYLSPSRNPLRKVKEYFIARSLENHLSKKRILELYLNVVEMGDRVYGAEAAARHYFHKSAGSLSPSEAALLAGSLPNPRVMDPVAPNKRLRFRQRMILARMGRWGTLVESEVLTERKASPSEPAPLTDSAPPPEPSPPEPAPTESAPPTTTT